MHAGGCVFQERFQITRITFFLGITWARVETPMFSFAVFKLASTAAIFNCRFFKGDLSLSVWMAWEISCFSRCIAAFLQELDVVVWVTSATQKFHAACVPRPQFYFSRLYFGFNGVIFRNSTNPRQLPRSGFKIYVAQLQNAFISYK